MIHRRILAFASLLVVLALPACAQNGIDRMVEKFSTVGGSKFTTVVQRDPKTRKVEKVVKRLTVSGVSSRGFIDTFEEEARRCQNTTTHKEGGYTTTTVVTKDAKSSRIYTMKRSNDQYFPTVTTTIIIKMRDD